MKKHTLFRILAAALLAVCNLSAQSLSSRPEILGSAVDPANDIIRVDDASVPAAEGQARKMKVGELVNVPGMFTNGNFLAANSVEFSQVNGLQPKIDQIDPNDDGGLANWRKALLTAERPSILLFGDSMIGTASIELSRRVEQSFGISARGLLTGTPSSGATQVLNDCTKWITGNYWNLPNGGEVLFSLSGVTAVPATHLKVYYVREPGAGTFEVWSSKDGGAYTLESGVGTVNADGVLAGQVITIAKTESPTFSNFRSTWRFKVVGTTAGKSVKIIGGGHRNNLRAGALLTEFSNSSSLTNNMPDQAATPTAITSPVLADLAPQLVILSHLDGASGVASQATVQDNLLAGITSASAPEPSFLIVGPPPGATAEGDVDRLAQVVAMANLADSRGDAFYDNRQWALPISRMLAKSWMTDGTHYTQIAAQHWTSEMWRRLSVDSVGRFGGNQFAEWRPFRGGVMRALDLQFPDGSGFPGFEVEGSFSLKGALGLDDSTGMSNANDRGYISKTGTPLHIAADLSGEILAVSPGSGGGVVLSQTTATTSAPKGLIGTATAPWREINLGKSIIASGTTGDRTIDRATGSVNFAAGAPSLVVTNSMVIAPTSGSTGSIISATVRTNDATMKSVVVTCSANGSFTLVPNAAPTGEVRVDFAIITP